MGIMYFEIPKNFGSGLEGYEFLAKFNFLTWDLTNSLIHLDFISNEWFDPNLCAPLGASIDSLNLRNNTVNIVNLQESTESTFKRNGFFKMVKQGFSPEDIHTPCIEYSYFKLSDVDPFQQYIDEKLLEAEAIPKMSTALKKGLNERILEIFNNAHEHGKCTHVFTCGQFFEREKKLRFTMADMGVTIRKNVNNSNGGGSAMTGVSCIKWAVTHGNTTKKGPIPGGLGFTLIRDFLRINKGSLQIVSSEGFWEEKNGEIVTHNLTHRFLGTIVTFEINLDDPRSYILASEKVDPQSVL